MAGIVASVRSVRFVLESGRRVAVHRTTTTTAWFPAEGRARGVREPAVVLCHSAPGAGSFDPDPAVTRARNVRLLSIDRPGYGGSDPVAAGTWATVAAAADDLATVLDGLSVERVGVAGWSAGGRVALALAARRPDLVDRVAVVATPAPDAEVPWIEGEQRTELERLRGLPPTTPSPRSRSASARLVPEDPLARGPLAPRSGPGRRGRAADAGARHRLGGDAASGVRPGRARPGRRHPRLLPAAVGLRAGGRSRQDAPAVRLERPARRPAARALVGVAAPRRPARGRPGAGHLLVVPMWARVLAHLAPDRVRLGGDCRLRRDVIGAATSLSGRVKQPSRSRILLSKIAVLRIRHGRRRTRSLRPPHACSKGESTTFLSMSVASVAVIAPPRRRTRLVQPEGFAS